MSHCQAWCLLSINGLMRLLHGLLSHLGVVCLSQVEARDAQLVTNVSYDGTPDPFRVSEIVILWQFEFRHPYIGS